MTRVNPAAAIFPSRRNEDWKYTDLLRHLRAIPPQSPALQRPVEAGGPLAVAADVELIVANGRLNWWPETDPAGFEITVGGDEIGQMADVARMPLASMAADRARADIVIIKVRGSEPRTLRLRWVSRASDAGHFGRVGILVEAGAHLSLIETIEGEGEGYFADHLLEIMVARGATCERVSLAREPASAISVLSTAVELSPGATFEQTVLTDGAKLQRHETRVTHPGQGAAVRLDGLYALGGERHADLTTEVVHVGGDGVTSQLTKGVVRDTARGVFQGRIVVREGADGTDARMGHHALILSDRGEVDAKPELEIYADDVQCAHGNTVGSLDENALFYMRSRGIPEAQGRALLTEAFLAEVTDRIGREDVRELCRAWLVERLG